MSTKKINRRMFVRTTALTAAGLSIGAANAFPSGTGAVRNKLPKWKGFNLLDIFSPYPPKGPDPSKTTEDDIKWMADWGFDFVRIPMAYPRYVLFDRSRDITKDEVYKFDEKVLEEIDKLISTAHKYNMHVSLNLHRGPGFCINAGFHEPFNLWKDAEAQDAFNFHWSMWAKRYKGIPSGKLSFDLLNEPLYREDMNDQFSKSSPLPGELYRKVAKGAADAIRAVDPDRLIVADGNGGGSYVTPELIDLNIAQSCRGYYPHYISHYQASWVWKDPAMAPRPVWPGIIDGKQFGRKSLEDFYAPWIELLEKGVGVHCGECGCYSKTPHEVFLAWFTDVIDILTSHGIGFALWNFRGTFGIMDSDRSDINYTDWYGHKLDSKLLDLIRKY
ncbi:MAG TPA: cellulase family glycosylhydrolase [Bacteroidales bacterium]|nr:cellulase family glycosylhydrolase [Bacteroidales bacterium]HPM18568.1 cellulase family glycosylhydrolase [Bacteroidales bacterium]HQG76931.1 cellulase family glycosylhydrolase [Bacteroidales bacterium]